MILPTAKNPGQRACADCRVRKRTEWAPLEEGQLGALECARIEASYLADEAVFRQGDPCEGLFCVRSGVIALRKTHPERTSVITRLVHAGETLGYRTLFAGGRYTSTAVPLVKSRLCFIPGEVVWQVLEQHPAVARRFLKRLSQQLMVAEEGRLELCALPLKARLARVLLDLADRFGVLGAEDELVFELPLTRQDLAAMIGARAESVTRGIRALEEAGLASFAGRKVSIPSLEEITKESRRA